MKNICFFFHLDLPIILNQYSFFDIGLSKPYFNDELIKQSIEKYSENCLVPTIQQLQETINRTYGNFKVILSISGISVSLLKKHAPGTLSILKELAKTGNIEFCAETYFESYASIFDLPEFESQIINHSKIIEKTFHQKPTIFRNTDFIFSDEIAKILSRNGLNSVITANSQKDEKKVASDFLYNSKLYPGINILFLNSNLSTQIAEKLGNNQEIDVLSIVDQFTNSNNTTCIEIQFSDFINISEPNFSNNNFILTLGRDVLKNPITFFRTSEEVLKIENPTKQLSFPKPTFFKTQILNSEPGFLNDLQYDALNKLYLLKNLVIQTKSKVLINKWNKLQHIIHFENMLKNHLNTTKYSFFSIPYNAGHDAYINFMNIINDFEIHLNLLLKKSLR